jgi:cytochrome c2
MRIINFGFIVLLCCAACHQEQKKQDTPKLNDTVQRTQPLDTGGFLREKYVSIP